MSTRTTDGGRTRRGRRGRLLLASAVGAGALGGCGGGGQPAAADAAAGCAPTWSDVSGWTCKGTGQIVTVTVRNFAIDMPAVIPTGKVTFVIRGAGPTLHEFNVARSDIGPSDLPLAADDTVDDTKNTPHFFWVAQVEGVDIGDTRTLTTNIVAGHYDFYCNMDGHYMAGMFAQAVAG